MSAYRLAPCLKIEKVRKIPEVAIEVEQVLQRKLRPIVMP
jgi:hypothetical protein